MALHRPVPAGNREQANAGSKSRLEDEVYGVAPVARGTAARPGCRRALPKNSPESGPRAPAKVLRINHHAEKAEARSGPMDRQAHRPDVWQRQSQREGRRQKENQMTALRRAVTKGPTAKVPTAKAPKTKGNLSVLHRNLEMVDEIESVELLKAEVDEF